MYGETFHRIWAESRQLELAAKQQEIDNRRVWAELLALDKLERAISTARGRVTGATTLSQAR